MKRATWIIAVALVAVVGTAGLVATGCTGSHHNDPPAHSRDQTSPKSEKAAQYACSMHPEVVRDKPGDCPKCGMKLAEKH